MRARMLLSHMALYGLGAILEADGVRDVRLAWGPPANPRPVLSADGADETELAARVGRHAQAHAAADSWVRRDVTLTVRSQDKPQAGHQGPDEPPAVGVLGPEDLGTGPAFPP